MQGSMQLWIVTFFVQFLLCQKSLYDILGVSKNASEKEIKAKYRKLAVKMHPDKNKDNPEASTEFAELSNAYQILSDKEKRQKYDLYGEDGRGGGSSQQGFNPFDFFGGGAGFDFSDMFGRGNRQQRAETQDVHIRLSVRLEDICRGKTQTMTTERTKTCTSCKGTGAYSQKDVTQCRSCGGSGSRVVEQVVGGIFRQQVRIQCNACGGKGRSIKKACALCKGKRVVQEDCELKVVIERGMDDGQQLVYKGHANEAPGQAPGDLVLVLHIAPDESFRRSGKDLETEATISLVQALTGVNMHLDLPDGSKLHIVRDTVVHPGERQRFGGRGVPYHKSTRSGDLYVVYKIVFPKSIADKRAVKALLGAQPRTEL